RGHRAAGERARARAGPRSDARVAGPSRGPNRRAPLDQGCRRMLSLSSAVTFLVCEDGSEYTDRFTRFLGAHFQFARAGHFAEALALAPSAQALLLDLDFRRTQRALLVDERGAPDPRSAVEVQGILILRA